MPKIIHSLISLNKVLKKEKPSKVCIVTSKVLGKKLKWAIKGIHFPDIKIVFIPDNEAAKEWDEVEKLLKKFIELNLDRNSIVLALGGGTVGDMVGFATAIYLRGIRYVQIPTTLLAQVDSAHGGKTGINFFKYKNQVGSFHQPIFIVINVRFLHSLSGEQVIDGLGEIIKAGLIKDTKVLSLLKKEKVSALIKSSRLSNIIDRAIRVKQFYINNDFKDIGVRQILNVGHTVAHAIELKYKISHGRAVIMGILQELKLTESLKITSPLVRKNLESLLHGLGIRVDNNIRADWKSILHDKKISGDKILFPVIEKEGRARLVSINLNIIKKALK